MTWNEINEAFKKAFGWPSKFLMGDDIFISYSRADGATYAGGLADKLAGQNFSCRFDMWGAEPGKERPKSLKGALARSHARLRREFLDVLRAAAAIGDEGARYLLSIRGRK